MRWECFRDNYDKNKHLNNAIRDNHDRNKHLNSAIRDNYVKDKHLNIAVYHSIFVTYSSISYLDYAYVYRRILSL